MAEPAASGPLSIALDNLRTLIANASYWQTLTGAANAPEAATFIKIGEIRDGDTSQTDARPARPFCLLRPGTKPIDYQSIGVNTRVIKGEIEIVIEGQISSGYSGDTSEALIEANNVVGNFLKMLDAQSGQVAGSTRLMFLEDIQTVMDARLWTVESQDDPTKRSQFWNAVVSVRWGND